MADIQFAPEALRDLEEIRDFISEDLANLPAANNTVSGILDNIKILASFPEIGSPLSAIVNIETNYRFLVCGHYMTFYRFEGGTVYVIRILYGRRNYMEILFGKQS